jgi:uncharacterized membrane protein YkoI
MALVAMLVTAAPGTPARALAAAHAGRWRGDDSVSLGSSEPVQTGALKDSGGIPRDRLIEMVQRRFNARVVRVNLVESGGRRIYEMRLLSEQRVWNVRVDADTGQVLDGG